MSVRNVKMANTGLPVILSEAPAPGAGEAKNPVDSTGFFVPPRAGVRMTPFGNPLLLAQADKAGAGSFYEKFDSSGVLDFSHPMLSEVRPDDPASVKRFIEAVRGDRGEDYAKRVLLNYFQECFRKNPLTWDSLHTYIRLEKALAESGDEFLKSIAPFVRQKVYTFVRAHRASCPDAYARICDEADGAKTLWERITGAVDKAFWHLTTGGLSRFVMKVTCKAEDYLRPRGDAGIDAAYRTGRISTKKIAGALPGFAIERVALNGRTVAVLVAGDPTKGARAGMDISIGGGATVESIEGAKGAKLVYQGPGPFQHGEKLPPELTIYNGVPVRDLPPDARRHDGYVLVFPDGHLHIADKRAIRLSEITGKPEDDWVVMRLRGGGDITDIARFKEEMKRAKASQIPAMLLISGGKVEWVKENGPDERRLLIQFGNGAFAVLSTITGGVAMGINDMLTLAIRLGERRGGVARAVYLDTGHYDYASYYTHEGGKRERVVIGHPDRTQQMCRIYFYQEK